MNICYLTKLGTGNPSLSLCLILIYIIRKAKTKRLCAAYSPRQYYSSSQTSVLVTSGKAWLLRSSLRRKVWKERYFSETNSSVYIFQVPDIKFSHHLLMLIKRITALGAVALTPHCFVDQLLTLQICLTHLSKPRASNWWSIHLNTINWLDSWSTVSLADLWPTGWFPCEISTELHPAQ